MKQFLICDLNISENIVRLRKKSNMTQNYVAIQLQTMGLNISRSRLSMIELNRLNVPISVLVALKVIFKCEFSDFFDGLEELLQTGVIE
ncbi:MAG: helix-turn-helix transcriptional regulator [Clostridiales bacterium]|nr:helix-turn-helix transcriptional regulator [Clostridiales bacterium]